MGPPCVSPHTHTIRTTTALARFGGPPRARSLHIVVSKMHHVGNHEQSVGASDDVPVVVTARFLFEWPNQPNFNNKLPADEMSAPRTHVFTLYIRATAGTILDQSRLPTTAAV